MSDEFINRAGVAGTSPGWIAFDTKTPRGALTTETVQFLERLDQFIRAQPNVSYTSSVATYIKRMNLVLNDMNPAFLRVPQAVEQVTVVDDDGQPETFEVDGNSLIEQHIMMFENGGGTDLQNVLNADYSKAVTLFTMTSSVAGDYQAMLDKLDAWLAQDIDTQRWAGKPFSPLPVLGVPGWWPANEDAVFYADPLVFRPPRGSGA